MAFELFNSYRGEAMPAVGLEVYKDGVVNPAPLGLKVARKGRSDKGVSRKAVKAKPVVTGKRGRPRLYNGTHRRIVAAALRKHGLTKGLEFLATERKLKVSLTLARSVAQQYGIKFVVGRPKAA
jgi:hypothetical protein